MRNRSIQPTSKWRNNQICDREGTLTVQQPEMSERKSTEGHVLYNLLLVWGGRTDVQAFLSCYSSFSSFCYRFIFPLCAHRGTNDFTCFPHRGAAPAPKTRPLAGGPTSIAPQKAEKGQSLQLGLHPRMCSQPQCRAGFTHTLLASHAFVAGKRSH